MVGEGFVFVDTEGTTYRFDIAVTRKAGLASAPGGHSPLLVNKVNIYLMASRVEDRHGNHVAYNYVNGRLQSIQSSDGRSIGLVYSGQNIVGATADGKTWTYGYNGNGLETVTLPDQSQWRYSYNGYLSAQFQAVEDDPLACGNIVVNSTPFSLSIRHPSGALGVFDFFYTAHLVSGTPAQWHCSLQFDPLTRTYSRYFGIPSYFLNYALGTKTVTGPGLQQQQWTYAYGWPETGGEEFVGAHCGFCDDSKSVYVTQPDGSVIEHLFGALWGFNNGVSLGKYIRSSSGVIVRSELNTLVTEDEVLSVPFAPNHGILMGSHDRSSQRNRPVKVTRIAQDGDIAGPPTWVPPPPPPPPPPYCPACGGPEPPVCDVATGTCLDPNGTGVRRLSTQASAIQGTFNESQKSGAAAAPTVFVTRVDAFNEFALPTVTTKWRQSGE